MTIDRLREVINLKFYKRFTFAWKSIIIMMIDCSFPQVMGILNITPDSFYQGSRFTDPAAQLRQVERMLSDGATIIDIGAVSTRPGGKQADEASELDRLLPAVRQISRHFPEAVISVDTYRSAVARAAVEEGASVINDIYGGRFDKEMIRTVAYLNVPFILMHMKGSPENMQDNPVYSDVVAEVNYFFEQQTAHCREQGIRQVILDPGFGFGKTVAHNFTLLNHLDEISELGFPVLAGISRKSMITKTLGCTPDEALNGTTVLNTLALVKGANILRVHDVREAVEAIRLFRALYGEID